MTTEYQEILNDKLRKLEKQGFEIIPSIENFGRRYYLIWIVNDTIKIENVYAIRKNKDGIINAFKDGIDAGMHYIKDRPIKEWCIVPAKNMKYIFKHAKEMCSIEAIERGRNLMNFLRKQAGYPEKDPE